MTSVNEAIVASERPSVVWLSPLAIRSRIDATYFGANFLQLDKKIARHQPSDLKPLGGLLMKPRRVMYLKTETFSPCDLPNGVPFISGVDVDEATMSVKLDGVRVVERSMVEQYPKGVLFDGAIVIKVKGPNQLATYIHKAPGTCLVSGSFVFAGVRGVDPWYLTAYLTNSFAQSWRTRLRQNITVEFTQYEELAQIPIIVPREDIQRAIGSKLRKAERLRDSAALKHAGVITRIDELFGQASWNGGEEFGWMAATKFAASRLDAWFYKPSYREMAEQLKRNEKLVPVSTVADPIRDAAVFSGMPGSEFEYFEIADVEADSGVITSKLVPTSQAPSRAKFAVEPGDVLVSTVRPNRKGVSVVPDSACAAICSSGFAPLRCQSKEIAHYARACLVHDIATDQLMRWNTGATYPAIDREVPLRVLIPWPGDDKAYELGSMLKGVADQLSEGQGLLDQARTNIDALVGGTLNEIALLGAGEKIAEWLKQN